MKAQSRILLDSNSYFRLAKNIHPLLNIEFGDKNYCLHVLKELDFEFKKNRRLKSLFAWVADPEYVENRRKKPNVSQVSRKKINITRQILRQHTIEHGLGASEIDIICLAHGYVQNTAVVTDDNDMLQLAKVFRIQVMKTLDLLKLMLTSDHIDMDKIRSIVQYWRYMDDMPNHPHVFDPEYRDHFNEDPPK